jgi:DNA-binding NarL/FixJ family response regulator
LRKADLSIYAMAIGSMVARRTYMAPLRILLVDDSAEFLESAARFLTMYQDLNLIGSANSGYDAIARVQELRPDLVLIDLAMPGMNGLETTRLLKARAEAPRVVIMTLHDNSEYRDAAREAAADGFIAKSAIPSQLFPMIASLFPKPLGI